MKKSYLKITLSFILISCAAESQTVAFPKNHPFAAKTSETVVIRYEKEEPTVYSNAANQAQVIFDNKNGETINFRVFAGEKEVPVMYGRSKTGTEETITIYTSQLAAGTYVCKIETGANAVTRKLIVSR
ncbi:MAG: T9SS type A sorting domain-containing protein [Bacteroidia bacterium]